MICPEPREIVGFSVSSDKSSDTIQSIVDSAPSAKYYNTDGYLAYNDVIYPGKHVQNLRDKSDTHNVESINADLRHYIPVLARKSRCFCRKIETLKAVVAVFVNAYNKFGAAKLKNRVPTVHKSVNHAKHLHKYREVGFSLADYL
jgi:IS1 family transposase